MNPPLRIAIVGCGAMTRDIHLPVLAGHDAFRVVALVDRDLPRAQALARSYQIPKVLCDLETIDRQEADGVLVVTPPGHHAAATLALVRRGFHVLVEKPFALSVDDAEAMVHAADAAGVVLAVGHHRRLYPATRMLRALLQQRPYGDIVSFDIEEGGIYNWPLVSLANLRRDQGGGGVLVDIGCHLLDQLLYCLPGEPLLQNYRDNARGGVETDCAIQLSLRTDREEVAGTVRLSRTCQLRGSIRVECAAATLELVTADRFRVHIHPRGKEMIDPVVGRAAPARLHASWDGIPEEPGRGAYRLEFEDWAQAIRLGTPPILDGRTTVPVVRLIEQCYSQRAPLREPWVEAGLPEPSPATHDLHVSRLRRVLLTGATGFIGCRAAEILHLGHGWQVRALVHNPGSAARLARLPVEMVQGDLDEEEVLKRAAEGCDAVVHCAVGPSWKSRQEVFAVNEGGTKRLVRAAQAAGVRRFVHLSTIAVYGSHVPAQVDETTPTTPDPGSAYGASKLAAERWVLEAARQGMAAVILRPAHVYGPYGKTFVINPLQHLAREALVVVAGRSTPSNTIHVDHVVGAVARCLEAGEGVIRGEVFNLGGDDEMMWCDYFDFFARALGKRLRGMEEDEWQRTQQSTRNNWALFRFPARLWHGLREILTSSELRSFARRCVQTDPYGAVPRWMLTRFPSLRKLAGLDRPAVYRPPTRGEPSGDLVMRFISARVSSAKANHLLGHAPVLSRTAAMESTLAWLRESRLIEGLSP